MTVEEQLIINGETADAVQALNNLERAAESASESMDGVAGQANTASQSLSTNLAPSMDVVAQTAASAEAKLTQMVGIIGSAAGVVSALTATNHEASEETKRLAEGFAAVATAAGSGAAAFGPYGALLGGLVAGITLLVQSLNRAETAHNEAAEAVRNHRNDLERLMETMARQREITELFRGLRSVTEQTEALSTSQERLAALTLRQTEAQQLLAQANRRQATATRLLTERDDLSAEARIRLTSASNTLAAQQTRLTAVVHGLSVAIDTEQSNINSLTVALGFAEIATDDLADASEAASEAASRQAAARTAHVAKRLEGIRETNQAEINAIALAHALSEERIEIGERLLAAELAQNAARMAASQAFVDAEIRLMDAQMRAEEAAARASAATQQERITKANELRTEAQGNILSGIDSYIASLNAANEAAQEMGTETISAADAMAGAMGAAVAQMTEALVGQLAAGFGAAIKAAVKGEKSFGEAMESMMEDVLFSIGQQALILSIFEFAKAIQAIAGIVTAGEAAGHIAAGVAFAGVAAAGFAGGAGLASSSASSAAAAGPPAGEGGPGTTGAGEGGAVINNTYIFPGTPLGSTSDDLVRQFNRLDRLNTRREGRR